MAKRRDHVEAFDISNSFSWEFLEVVANREFCESDQGRTVLHDQDCLRFLKRACKERGDFARMIFGGFRQRSRLIASR